MLAQIQFQGPLDVRRIVLEELKQHGTLFQESAAHKIREQFGATFVYTNLDGNLAIGKEVLNAFKKLSKDVVWVREDR